MFSFGVKIQILVFLVVILIGLYVFVMQKEMKMMQYDLSMLRKEIMDSQTSSTVSKPQDVRFEEVHKEEEEEQVLPLEEEDDDVVSVTSNEIKEILTNISHVELPPSKDIIEMSEVELEGVKVDELKKVLKSHDVEIPKASKKHDLIKLVMSLRE